MKIRPWFLATVSLGFVAFILLVRGDSSLSTGEKILDGAIDAAGPTRRRVISSGRKVLGQGKKRIAKSVPASDLAIERLADPTDSVVKKSADKSAKARRPTRRKTVG
jgi:hypothetical protein